MFKLKKIIYILMIAIMIIVNFSIFLGENKTKATVLPEGAPDLYSKGKVTYFNYKGSPVEIELVFYKKGNTEYPVYGLNQAKNSFSSENDYEVKIDGLVTNQKIWKVITNGYPFKTVEELGCEAIQRDYAATKIAVSDVFNNYDLTKLTQVSDEDASTVAAAKSIIEKARSSKQSKTMGKLEIKEASKWQVDDIDGNYVSKTYTVTASASNRTYDIYIAGDNLSDVKVTKMNNSINSEFPANEKFKVIIPISKLPVSGQFTIYARSSLKTYPIYHAQDSEGTYEDFAVTAGEYETVEASYVQNYEINRTKIKVLKQDGDTERPLQGAVFNLLDQNKSILYSELTTNESGIIEISDLAPGIYYLEEVSAPNGYYGYDELIKVDTTAKELVEIIVDNFVDEGEKVVPEEPEENHYTNKRLPTTGF